MVSTKSMNSYPRANHIPCYMKCNFCSIYLSETFLKCLNMNDPELIWYLDNKILIKSLIPLKPRVPWSQQKSMNPNPHTYHIPCYMKCHFGSTYFLETPSAWHATSMILEWQISILFWMTRYSSQRKPHSVLFTDMIQHPKKWHEGSNVCCYILWIFSSF